MKALPVILDVSRCPRSIRGLDQHCLTPAIEFDQSAVQLVSC